jgi:hypothetical protein
MLVLVTEWALDNLLSGYVSEKGKDSKFHLEYRIYYNNDY